MLVLSYLYFISSGIIKTFLLQIYYQKFDYRSTTKKINWKVYVLWSPPDFYVLWSIGRSEIGEVLLFNILSELLLIL